MKKTDIEAGKARAVGALKKAADDGAKYKRLMEAAHDKYYRAKMDLAYWQGLEVAQD